MCVFSFHFEMRVVSPVRRVVYLYLTGIDNLPVHLGYKGTNNDRRVRLQLFSSFNEVNEHEESDIWPDGTCRFRSIKTLLDSNTSFSEAIQS